MPLFRTGRCPALLGLTALLAIAFSLAYATTTQAQVLSDPRIAEFDPSPDHWAVLADNNPAVLRYELSVYLVGASEPLAIADMGKPAPEPDGKIRYDFSAQVAAWSLPGGYYDARVSAVGPEGSALSEPSNPFAFTSNSHLRDHLPIDRLEDGQRDDRVHSGRYQLRQRLQRELCKRDRGDADGHAGERSSVHGVGFR